MMAASKDETKQAKLRELVAEQKKRQAERERGYRERALQLFPHVCAHCGREFAGRNLRDLTVHHKDHNHDNNPPDGSNWELLCIYCHDNQHQRDLVADMDLELTPGERDEDPATHKPFAKLADLLKKK